MRVNRTLLRGRASLTESAADLVSLCTPSAKELLGMWLEDMAEIFCKRHTLWKKDREACKQAEVIIPVQQSKCKIAASVLNERKQQCDRELDRAESFSCSWATGFATRCLRTILVLHLFSNGTPTQFVKQMNQSCVGGRVGWPLQGWSVWRMPWTIQAFMIPSCTLVTVKTSPTCPSS